MYTGKHEDQQGRQLGEHVVLTLTANFCGSGLGVTTTTTTTTINYFNEIVFPSVLGSTSPMAFPQHFPPP